MDSDSEPDLEKSAPADRIRWQDSHNARQRQGEPSDVLHRSHSAGSLSIRSARSRQVDPYVALPIQYRTVSFKIEESKSKDAVNLAQVKDKTTKELSDLDWHTISTDEALRRLSSSIEHGLSTDQVNRKKKEHGRNAPSKPPSNTLSKYFFFYAKGFGPILLTGAVLVFLAWKPLGQPPALANLALAIVLVGVFVLQGTFNMFQDWSTSRVMASIKGMLPEDCLTRREGENASIPAQELVPGDIVFVKAGDKLPADLRFVEVSSDAKFDRAVLTGESVPLAATVDSTDDNYLETKCIGLQGTHCTSGKCTGLVVSTGDKTVFGRIAQLTNEPKSKMTTLEREIMYFVFVICAFMFSMISLVLILWGAWLRKDHPDWINVPTLIVDCVSVAIAFIPEGLPIAVTASLTITANIMRKQKILCKSLKTVETLGAVSVICSDKTGTLTENRMTVTEYYIGSSNLSVDGAAAGDGLTATSAISQLRAMAALCNAAEFDAADMQTPVERRKAYGDATDQAILRFAEQLGSAREMRQGWKRTFELAFNSKNKFMIRTFALVKKEAVHGALPESENRGFQEDTLLTIKGAPDVLISRCSSFVTNTGTEQPLDAAAKTSFEEIKNTYSSQGKRCILLARKIIRNADLRSLRPGSTEYESDMASQAKTGLTLVGLVAIVDPLRPEIRSVVATLRGAGIRFFMVTGDFALTALAIAQDAGIVTVPSAAVHKVGDLPRQESPGAADGTTGSSDNGNDKAASAATERRSIVVSGPEMLHLTDYQWTVLTQYREIVFARTTPEQKLRIVREFQRDKVVAMTGDGVNDAPSLKAADIGIALGSGSDIAIEAADMVLLESFAGVVEAVKYGRVVFDNLKKVIAYLLPAGSFSEFWPIMMNVLFGLPQILSSFLMIIICCFTDCAAATALAYEKPEADVLLRKPRNTKTDRLVDLKLIGYAYGVIGIIETLASFAMSFWYLQRNGISFSVLWLSYGRLPDWIDPVYYPQKVNEASCIYFVNLVVMQWFNLMAVRTRRWSVVQQPPLFRRETRNWLLFPAMLFGLGMVFLWCYIPALQRVIVTAQVPVEHFFIPMGFGLGLLLVDEGRKFGVRRWPGGVLSRIAW
ncbi:Na+/H+/K+ antiporter P-type ATPase [Coniochaeta ligniaria NRRL 30616]|uniref:Na+/H+/K+ antiporter P-type ATPase n=1 Tax=Coniochaeta ligniaria NRRL 30616 TaxID=1408157 RepID=A0A1J7IJR2_9PEZI|nr:Na+/H+/K+ antiporter P-type ATPase [Coniochaeta ligniaria NRRL 30616]